MDHMDVRFSSNGHSGNFEHERKNDGANDKEARAILVTHLVDQGGKAKDADAYNLTKLTTSPKHPGRVWATFTKTGEEATTIDLRWDVPQPSATE